MKYADDGGLLIAFEGPDGSGKTTQRKLLQSWLHNMERDVVLTKWNSSPLVKPIIKARKAEQSLDPTNFAILHATDFLYRYENVIQPALAQGKIVIADRYIFTGLSRDVARGLEPEWVAKLYAGVRQPDLVFYFKARVDTCAMRIAASRQIKFYEAGQDVTGITDPYQSYLCFASRVVAEYERLSREFGFVTVDAERPIYEQHRFIRETYLQRWTMPAPEPTFQSQLHAVLSQVDV
jgi:dTMP kinase